MKRCILLLSLLLLASVLPAMAKDSAPENSAPTVYAVPEYTPSALVVTLDPIEGAPARETAFDPFDDDEYFDEAAPLVSDPFEGWNRFWFGFNDVLYLDILKPLHKGYSAVTPWELRAGVSNFFHNLLFPVRFVGAILQGKFADASVETARFIVNTTAGFGGLMNPAADKKPLIEISGDEEDFGQTLGVWGIGQGPYLVWPLIGPSTLRDSVGLVGDSFLNPVSYVTPWYAEWGLKEYDGFNSFDSQLAVYEELKKSAIEPYTAIRDAYIQSRQARVAE